MIEFIDEPAIIDPVERELDIDVAVTTFSRHLMSELIEKRGAKPLCVLTGGADIQLYVLEHAGKRIAVYQSPIGAPAAAATIEEVYAAGIKRVIAFGICGALTAIPTRNLVVPTRAYRDEGTSYHYLPPSEFIELKNSAEVERNLRSLGLDCAVGAAWTTDGFYRETRTRAEHMKARGCIAVDMECAALQAVSDFRNKQFYTFFITADSLAGDKWEPNYLLDLSSTEVEGVAAAAALNLAVTFIA